MNVKFRTEIILNDIIFVREIVSSTGFFYEYEIETAVELISIALKEGQLESGYNFIMAELDNRIVAYACFGEIACTKGSYDLYWLCVHNDYRGQGIGRLLLEQTHFKIKQLKGRLLVAETSGTEKYSSTRNFYEKNGYNNEAVIKDFYLDGDDKVMYIYRI